jgi:hypothetical protein
MRVNSSASHRDISIKKVATGGYGMNTKMYLRPYV